MITSVKVQERTVHFDAHGVELEGSLSVPVDATGVVLFAHGSGSSRHSRRNIFVAESLQQYHLATLLIDLLSSREEEIDAITRQHRFDIQLLANRLDAAIDWLGKERSTAALSVGLFGASTGGGAALVAAADKPNRVGAVVSRGGRPDLAGTALTHVRAPTLLIVGERDEMVIDLNREAMAQMTGEVQLEIVPRATHLFEEPGTLDRVAELARNWFVNHLSAQR